MIDATFDTPEEAAFRREVRQFIDENLTGELRRLAHQEASSFAHAATSVEWHGLLHKRGWVASGWPKEYGGTGWSPRQRYIFEWEMGAAGAPRIPNIGVRMVGPVLMKYGTPEQRDYFLQRMLSGEHYWCQGYSEPGAGSDLAALQLRAVRDGDHYVLNGSKMWTTFAQYANWIFLLVRTSTEGKPHRGISFLVAPLDLPGITIRPFISMSGDHDVNQVFFDDVRVPVKYLVGDENQAWAISKYLLEFERGVGHPVPAMFVELAKLRTIARQECADNGEPLWEDSAFRHRYAGLEIEALASFLTEQRLIYSLPVGQNIGDATASLMKLSWSETTQKINQLTMDALGKYAAVDQHKATGPNATMEDVGPAYALTPTIHYLNDRVLTIAAGSSEIQRNILARVALGL